MKKKFKLKGWVKVALTIILIIGSVVIYSKVGTLGELAQTETGYQLVCVGAWFWLLLGQMIAYSIIWND